MEILKYKTDIGLVRKNNEDCVLAIKHPKNKNIKLLVVADGMGGRADGEIASHYIVESLKKWFENKDVRVLNNNNKTLELLKRYIITLNNNLIRKYGKNHLGTTLTLALINKKNTLLINIGDSRAYIYKNKKLIQLTEDDSDAWAYYKFGEVKKDDLRYFANNSLINACIGICEELCRMSVNIIDNDYELILLLTDGVTDLITDKKINKLIKKTKREMILEKIIHEAVYVNQHLYVPFRLKNKYLANYVVPFKGRDNASGAIYIKNV